MQPNTLPWLTPEFKEQMRKQRNESLPAYKKHAISFGVLAVIAVLIGVATIVLGALDVSNRGVMLAGGPLATGILGCVCLGFSYLLYKSGKEDESKQEPSETTRKWFVVHYVLHLITMICAFNLMNPIIRQFFVCNWSGSGDDDDCQGRSTAILAISIIGLIIALIMGFWAMVAVCFFCRNARAFGMKSRQMRMMEASAGMASAGGGWYGGGVTYGQCQTQQQCGSQFQGPPAYDQKGAPPQTGYNTQYSQGFGTNPPPPPPTYQEAKSGY